jgi:hypothetical protein
VPLVRALAELFGVWRTPAGKHRRIDLVVCSFPEEAAICRLSWTGSRLLNRLLRQYAQQHGLCLSAHALLVTQADQPLVIRERDSGRIVRIPEQGQAVPVEVPYEYLQSARDILWLLAGCTSRFDGLIDPRHRNA